MSSSPAPQISTFEPVVASRAVPQCWRGFARLEAHQVVLLQKWIRFRLRLRLRLGRLNDENAFTDASRGRSRTGSERADAQGHVHFALDVHGREHRRRL